MSATVPFQRIAHCVAVPVEVGDGIHSQFILDTGIGVPVLSTSLHDRAACQRTGVHHSGQRMSGQTITTELSRLAALRLGPCQWRDVRVVGYDLTLPPSFAGIEGFLSLGLFEDQPFTVCPGRKWIRFEEDDSISQIAERSSIVPISLRRSGPEVSAFLTLALPGGSTADVEVDMGSDALILHSRYLPVFGLNVDSPDLERVEGMDETGHRYLRLGGRLPEPIAPVGALDLAQDDVGVVFQEIIYDGLIGDAFLRRYDVTYDLPRSRLLFQNPS